MVSFWFREVLNIIILPFIREENQFCRLSSIPTVQQWIVRHWFGFYRSEDLALIIWVSGGEISDRLTYPIERLSYAIFPITPPQSVTSSLFVWWWFKSCGKNKDLSIRKKLVKIVPRKYCNKNKNSTVFISMVECSTKAWQALRYCHHPPGR